MKLLVSRVLSIVVIVFFYTIKPLGYLYRKFFNKNIYIFAERGYDAEDNAFIMYNYSKNKVFSYYLIKKNNKYKNRFSNDDRLLYYGTLKHLLMLSAAEYIVSTHGYLYIPCKLSLEKKAKIFKFHAKIIFLGHGLIKDSICGPSHYDLFVSSSIAEQKFIIKQTMLDDSIVQCLGLPRFDNLFNSKNIPIKKTVLVMPTWRLYIKDQKTLISSDYYKKWIELINDSILLQQLKKNGYSLFFYPHIELRKLIPHDLMPTTNKTTQELLITSSILVTDYSSVAFDFAYMFKPVIYYQFDKNKYFAEHYKKGYHDYEKDGFGPVCTTIEEIRNSILCAINKPDKLSKYQNRAKKTFKYIDSNNRKRVFEAIQQTRKHHFI